MNHKLSKKCKCNPTVVSFKGNKAASEVMLSYLRILSQGKYTGYASTVIFEREAERLLKRLKRIK